METSVQDRWPSAGKPAVPARSGKPLRYQSLGGCGDVDNIIPHLRWMPTFLALLHFRPPMAPVWRSPEEIAGRALVHLAVIVNEKAANEKALCRAPPATAGRPLRRLRGDAENACTNRGVDRSPGEVM